MEFFERFLRGGEHEFCRPNRARFMGGFARVFC
jgi:hypothetical protein